MAISKIIYKSSSSAQGETWVDLTQDTVSDASHIRNSYVGHLNDGTSVTGTYSGGSPSLQAKTNIAPTTSSQTITADSGYDGLSSVQINAMPSGTEGTPSASKGTVSNHSVSVTPSVTNTAGYISGGSHTGTAVTVSASELASGNKAISSNGTGIDVVGYSTVSVSVPTGTARTSSDVTVSGDTVSIPAGLYSSAVSKSVASGTAGTPTATKGTVSNHSISVTPSVTNTTGYITGSTKTGTAVTVSASELVSGSETKTANGTYDVTNLASLVVNVSSGGGLDLLQTTSLGALSTSSTSATDTGKTVSLAQSTGWQSYDLLLVDISVDTTTNGRHTSTVTPVLVTGTSNVSTKNTYTVVGNKWNSKLGSTGTASTRQSTSAYGVYINSASASSNTLTLTVYYRYNNNSTGTLNGTYTARVYGIKLIDLIGG